MSTDKNLQQNIDVAKSHVPKSGQTAIEDITESLDNSPIWPDEKELKENEKEQGHAQQSKQSKE